VVTPMPAATAPETVACALPALPAMRKPAIDASAAAALSENDLRSQCDALKPRLNGAPDKSGLNLPKLTSGT